MKLCPKCRGEVRPNDGSTRGAWYCPRCESAYFDADLLDGAGRKLKVVR